MSRPLALGCLAVGGLVGAAVGCTSPAPGAGTRADSRATISGVVILADVAGADDMSRVQVNLGAGEGSITPDADGSFNAVDLEPDVYAVSITYNGGLGDMAQGSAYAPFSARVVARAGASVSLGTVLLPLGTGTVRGSFTQQGGAPVGPLLVRLVGDGGLHEALSADGTYEITDVPVGRYVVYAVRSGAAGVCGREVVVPAHGSMVTVPSQPLNDGEVVLQPGVSGGQGQTFVVEGNRWFLRGDSVTVLVPDSTDLRGRAWMEGDTRPPFQTLESGLTFPALPVGATLGHVQIQDACGQELQPMDLVLIRDERAPDVRAELDTVDDFIRDPATRHFISAADDHSTTLMFQQSLCEGDGHTLTCTPERLDENDESSWRPLVPVVPVTFSSVDGVKEVRLRVRDQSLNVSETVTLHTVLDRAAPTGVSLLLDGIPVTGAVTVYRRDVRLEVTATDDLPMQMRVGLDATFFGAMWRPVLPIDLDLGTVDGVVTLYVQLEDLAGNVTAPLTVDVTVNNRARLRGRVQLERGTDNSGATVSLEGTQYSAITASDGSFEILGIPSATYNIAVAAPQHRTQRVVGVFLPAPAGFDLGTVVLEQVTGILRGTALLEQQEQHGGITVTLQLPGGGTRTTVSQGDGTWLMELSPGTYNGPISFRRPGFGDAPPYTDPAVILQDQVFDVGTRTLEQLSNTFTGTAGAELPDGSETLAGIRVRVLSEASGAVAADVLTTAGGSWATPLLPLGTYRVELSLASEPGLEVVTLGGQQLGKGGPRAVRAVRLRARFVTINADAPTTNSRTVTLGLSTGSGCNEVELSAEEDFTPVLLREACAATKTVTLPTGDGTKTVFARFYTADSPTAPSPAVSDSIVLDTVANVSSCTVSPTGTVTLGTTLRVVLTTGNGPLAGTREVGGTATVSIAGYVNGVLAHDDGLLGDATADDGIYTLDYQVDVPRDVNNAAVSCAFRDRAGNTPAAPTTAGTVSIRVPPLISGVRLSVDTQARLVNVQWTTDEPTTGAVRYGATAAYGSIATDPQAATQDHAVTFSSAALDPGTTYHFAVSATDASGNTSQTPDSTFVLRASTPTFVAAVPGNGRVWVRWEGSVQRGIRGYNIRRSTQPDSGFVLLNAQPYTHEVLMFEDTTVQNGTPYHYQVTTVDGAGVESLPSQRVSATPGLPAGPTVVDAFVFEGTTVVWSELGSPYLLAADFVVERNGLLVVGPNVEVVFAASQGLPRAEKQMRVEGRIAVLGARGAMVPDGQGGMTEDDSGRVVFRSNAAAPEAGDWGNITVSPLTPPGFIHLLQDEGTYVAGNVFHRVVMRHFGALNHSVGGNFRTVAGGIVSRGHELQPTALYVSHALFEDGEEGSAVDSNDKQLLVRDVTMRRVLVGVEWLGCQGLVEDAHLAQVRSGILMNENAQMLALNLQNPSRTVYHVGVRVGAVHRCDAVSANGAPVFPYRAVSALVRRSSVTDAALYGVKTGPKVRMHRLDVRNAYYGVWADYSPPDVFGNQPEAEPSSRAISATLADSRVEGGTRALSYIRAANMDLRGAVAAPGQTQETTRANVGELHGSVVGGGCTGACGVNLHAQREAFANLVLAAPSSGRPTFDTDNARGTFRYNHFRQPLVVNGTVTPAFFNDHPQGVFQFNSMLMTVAPTDVLVEQGASYVAGTVINMENNWWGPLTTAQMDAFGTRNDVDTILDYWDVGARTEADYIPYARNAYPLPHIDSPYLGQRFVVGEAITFRGTGTDPEAAGPVTLSWLSDSGSPLGGGATVSLSTFPPGDHKVVLVATDASGLEARVPVYFTVWPQL